MLNEDQASFRRELGVCFAKDSERVLSYINVLMVIKMFCWSSDGIKKKFEKVLFRKSGSWHFMILYQIVDEEQNFLLKSWWHGFILKNEL